MKKERELGSERREAVWSLSFVGVMLRKKKRKRIDGVSPLYERTRGGESVVLQLFFQEQRCVATLLQDNH